MKEIVDNAMAMKNQLNSVDRTFVITPPMP